MSAALHLQERGVKAQVLEKESRPGGLVRTEQVGHFQFDYAGHLLHFRDREMEKYLKTIIGEKNLGRLKRRSFIFSKKVLTPYPFQVHTYGLPAEVIRDCILGFIQAKLNPAKTRPANFKQWIIQNLGAGFAEHFLFPFNQKFWKIPLEQLDSQWAEWAIPKPAIKDVIEGALGINRSDFGYNAWFYYPKQGGIEKIARAMSQKIANISLNREIISVHPKDMKILLANGQEMGYDSLVSTMPLKELVKRLKNAPELIEKAGQGLSYVSVLCVNLGIKGPWLIGFTTRKTPIYFTGWDFTQISLRNPRNTSQWFWRLATFLAGLLRNLRPWRKRPLTSSSASAFSPRTIPSNTSAP